MARRQVTGTALAARVGILTLSPMKSSINQFSGSFRLLVVISQAEILMIYHSWTHASYLKVKKTCWQRSVTLRARNKRTEYVISSIRPLIRLPWWACSIAKSSQRFLTRSAEHTIIQRHRTPRHYRSPRASPAVKSRYLSATPDKCRLVYQE